MKIKWTAPALRDIEDAVQFIAQDNQKAALKAASSIWEATKALSRQPGMGRPGRVPKTREWVVSKTPYIIAYRAESNYISILRILHSSRKWPVRM